MILTLLKRIIRSGWQGFYRDGEIAAATIFILFLAVSLIGSLYIFKDVSEFLMAKVQEKVDVSVYFKEQMSEESIFDVRDKIADFPETKNIEYVSSQQALDDFVKRHEREPLLIDSIDELGRNPFLASLNITTFDPGQYEKIASVLESAEYEDLIEKVDYYQRRTVIESVQSLSSSIGKAGVFSSFFLVIVAIAVTFNTIRLSIYNSSKEITIQRLVGASNWFIRGPFLVQGIICGVLASLISLLIFGVVSWALAPKISSAFFDLNLFEIFRQNLLVLFLLQVTAGVLLGTFSSMVAIRKYLKV